MTNPQQNKQLLQQVVVRSPGRINLIGEHTDYNDGFVLPAAVDKSMEVRLQRNGTAAECRVKANDLKEEFVFDLNNFSPLAGGWQNYVMGVVHELQQLGAQLNGFDCQFEGDVPIGGGMSSSAALECSLAYALDQLFELGFDRSQLIKASQMAEHNFVGIKCGIMDQFASMMGKKDQVILLDCRSMEYQYFPLLLADYQLLLLNTNVSHTLASSAYNTRREECEEGARIIRKKYPEVHSFRDVSVAMLTEVADLLPTNILQRCRHVITENERVLEATRALQSGNFSRLGQLLYQSHFSLQNDYEVSCPELDFLIQHTLDKDYLLGGRMMGGGFGGCTINIIAKDRMEEFVSEVARAYTERFGLQLTPYQTSIGEGTRLVDKSTLEGKA